MNFRTTLIAASIAMAATSPAQAISIAVFGDNGTDNFITTTFGPGSATLVSDAQLATAGFLNGFDAFFMTRNGSSFGSGLSAAAAANVATYVGPDGAVVLMNCDCADGIPGDATLERLFSNAVSLAAASGHGFIGEFNGATSALTANGSGFNPIGLIAGSAGGLAGGGGGSGGSMNVTAAGIGSDVLAGVSLPHNPGSVEFGATISGVDASLVVATYDNGNAAIIYRSGQAVPEPSALALAGIGLMSLVGLRRRKQ